MITFTEESLMENFIFCAVHGISTILEVWMGSEFAFEVY